MPFYEVITPLDNGGSEPISPGETVELSKREGDALVKVGALAPGAKPKKPPEGDQQS